MAEAPKLFKVTIDNITVEVEPGQLFLWRHGRSVVM